MWAGATCSLISVIPWGLEQCLGHVGAQQIFAH